MATCPLTREEVLEMIRANDLFITSSVTGPGGTTLTRNDGKTFVIPDKLEDVTLQETPNDYIISVVNADGTRTSITIPKCRNYRDCDGNVLDNCERIVTCDDLADRGYINCIDADDFNMVPRIVNNKATACLEIDWDQLCTESEEVPTAVATDRILLCRNGGVKKVAPCEITKLCVPNFPPVAVGWVDENQPANAVKVDLSGYSNGCPTPGIRSYVYSILDSAGTVVKRGSESFAADTAFSRELIAALPAPLRNPYRLQLTVTDACATSGMFEQIFRVAAGATPPDPDPGPDPEPEPNPGCTVLYETANNKMNRLKYYAAPALDIEYWAGTNGYRDTNPGKALLEMGVPGVFKGNNSEGHWMLGRPGIEAMFAGVGKNNTVKMADSVYNGEFSYTDFRKGDGDDPIEYTAYKEWVRKPGMTVPVTEPPTPADSGDTVVSDFETDQVGPDLFKGVVFNGWLALPCNLTEKSIRFRATCDVPGAINEGYVAVWKGTRKAGIKTATTSGYFRKEDDESTPITIQEDTNPVDIVPGEKIHITYIVIDHAENISGARLQFSLDGGPWRDMKTSAQLNAAGIKLNTAY